MRRVWKNTHQAIDIGLSHGSGGGIVRRGIREKKCPYTSSFYVLTMGIYYSCNLKNIQLRHFLIGHVNPNSKHVRFNMSPPKENRARKYSLPLMWILKL